MTITATVPKKGYTATGATGDFTYDFKISAATDILVYANGILLISGYSVTGVGSESGGIVTITPVPVVGTKIILLRSTTRNQGTDWTPNDPDPAESKEQAFDKAMSIDQEQDEILSRTPQYKVTETFTQPRINTPIVGQFLRHADSSGNIDSASVTASGAIGIPVSFAQGGTGASYASRDAMIKGVTNAQAGDIGKFFRGDGLYATPYGLPKVVGLVGTNNTGTPNTQYDLSAQGITFYNPSDGTTLTKFNQSVLTNNVATAGPAANGRDQVGVFSANSWIHFYFIVKEDGTVATLSSTVAPPTGPTLPALYVAWAYAGAVRFGAASQLALTKLSGAWAYPYGLSPNTLSAGQATTATQVTISDRVPPNALAFTVLALCIADFATTTGDLTMFLGVNSLLSATSYMGRADASCQVLSTPARDSNTEILPGSTLYYLTAATGTGVVATHGGYINITAYKLPNGGE